MIKQFKVKFRQSTDLVLKTGAKPLEGRTFSFSYGWEIESEDPRYPNEAAWIPRDQDYPFEKGAPTWIASGDLEEVLPVSTSSI